MVEKVHSACYPTSDIDRKQILATELTLEESSDHSFSESLPAIIYDFRTS